MYNIVYRHALNLHHVIVYAQHSKQTPWKLVGGKQVITLFGISTKSNSLVMNCLHVLVPHKDMSEV